MNLKNSFILFLILILTHFYGNEKITINLHENIYLLSFIEVNVFLLTIFFGIITIIKLVKKYISK